LSILKERLERLGHGADDWQSIVAPTNALISAGIKSASKTLQILTDEESLLGWSPSRRTHMPQTQLSEF
jgi:hypothetical protein